MKNPYEVCPTLETKSFFLRLVSEEDAKDLLKCYSDSKSQKIFNSDKCTGDFCMYTIEDMSQCIKAWLHAYSQEEFVRFAIVAKQLAKPVGTVEMFGHVGKNKTKTGILRVDVSSEYESTDSLDEIFRICGGSFFDLFKVDQIATKAIPQAVERRNALLGNDFVEGYVPDGVHYFLRSK